MRYTQSNDNAILSCTRDLHTQEVNKPAVHVNGKNCGVKFQKFSLLRILLLR